MVFSNYGTIIGYADANMYESQNTKEYEKRTLKIRADNHNWFCLQNQSAMMEFGLTNRCPRCGITLRELAVAIHGID